MNPYEALGVEQNATPAEIKKAYKRKAQVLHPDKPTGDATAFGEVQAAYDLLSDSKRKAQFDQFGTTQTGPDIDQLARTHLVQLFGLVIDREIANGTLRIQSIIDTCRDEIKAGREQVINKIPGLAAKLEKLEALHDRVTSTEENLFEGVLQEKIQAAQALQGAAELERDGLDRMLELLDAYSDTKPTELPVFGAYSYSDLTFPHIDIRKFGA